MAWLRQVASVARRGFSGRSEGAGSRQACAQITGELRGFGEGFGFWNCKRGYSSQWSARKGSLYDAVVSKSSSACGWKQQRVVRYQEHMRRGYSGMVSSRMSVRESIVGRDGVIRANGLLLVSRRNIGSLVEGLTQGQRKAVTWWLGLSSGWVFSMVVLGGVTRLTRSGLSMTDWKFTGERPPQSEGEWMEEFERYKLSPEYKRVNKSMSLEEFKFIYWMEWAHRMWGRGLGIAFIIPCALFAWRGAITRPLASRLALLFTMGGTQAFVGWWMVRSGLKEPDSPHEIPRVSPYRLASHLVSAFAIYALMVWTTLSTAFPVPLAANTKGSAAVSAISKLKSKSIPFAALLSVTAFSGAFVAGLDAGHAYNTFPLMNGKLIPDEYWGIPGWRNAFENTAAVQFHHRCLAVSTLLGSMALWKYGMGLPSLPRTPRLLLHGLVIGTGLQVTLGITTLLTYVPVSLGSAHQAGALSLFTISLALIHSLRSPTASALHGAMAKFANPLAAACVVGIGGLAASTA